MTYRALTRHDAQPIADANALPLLLITRFAVAKQNSTPLPLKVRTCKGVA